MCGSYLNVSGIVCTKSNVFVFLFQVRGTFYSGEANFSVSYNNRDKYICEMNKNKKIAETFMFNYKVVQWRHLSNIT